MKIAIIGAGWSGLAAAVQASQRGHETTVFEAARTLGGRARALSVPLSDGRTALLDNGQHILIGAYTQTMALMRCVGVDPDAALLRLPLDLRFPDGGGLALPQGYAPLDALAGILGARGWSWHDKLSLLQAALRWQWRGFTCDATVTVAQLCHSLTPRLRQEFIEPLCLSALNTPAQRASGQVFLRVLRDSLFAAPGSSNLLLPRVDLSQLFPEAAAAWLELRGTRILAGQRVTSLGWSHGWQVQGERYDQVLLATGASDAARLLEHSAAGLPGALTEDLSSWCEDARALQFEAITTVYAQASGARLARPMMALRSDTRHPAQFAFDRGQLGGPAGLIALVASASVGERQAIQDQALGQAQTQLGLTLQPLRSITEKRATFACTAGLRRPVMDIAPGLRACADYVAGPYPATLEGAVRNGLNAVPSQVAIKTGSP